MVRNLSLLILNNLMAKIDSIFVKFDFSHVFLEHIPDENRGLPVYIIRLMQVIIKANTLAYRIYIKHTHDDNNIGSRIET